MDPPSSYHSHAISSAHSEPHYSQQQSQQQQQQQQSSTQQSPWPQAPHLLPPSHNQSSFPSPSSPSTSLSDQHYPPPFYSSQSQTPSSQPSMNESGIVDRASLSLNLSSLSVASPTNLSPVHPSPHPNSHISPITPISPSNAGLHSQNSLSPHHHHHHAHHMQQQPFQFTPPDHGGGGGGGMRYDDGAYADYTGNGRRLTSSRSSSSSEKSVPRKRSFTTTGTPLAPSAIEEAQAGYTHSHSSSATPMDTSTSPYDEVDMNYAGLDAEGSPVDGTSSGGEQDDQLKPLDTSMSASGLASLNAGVNVLGKPLGTNNFVTKLYQMINDPKSAQFISWTELGTSFVVSNVGEFSRTILGSHFKHNNFSSFVRQLNMYGFHKINRTPRAQRTSADVQTWEFSHHKFLRGRPDLLEEIKRKALEPDPSIKHRVELPGEVAAQLSQMRDDNRRLSHALASERNKVDKLASVTKVLFDVVTKAFPGSVPLNFPADILDPNDTPPIMVTSPTNPMSSHNHSHSHSHFGSLSSLSNPSLHSLHSLSPSSSPTAAEFPSHTHTPHTLSRQQSFQHMPYDHTGSTSMHSHHQPPPHLRYDTAALSTPLPPSPGPGPGLDGGFGDDRGNAKRQRVVANGTVTDVELGVGVVGVGVVGGVKKGSRARSDSAPLGYGLGGGGWPPQGRPRSGSGLGGRGVGGQNGIGIGGRRGEEGPVPNIGSLSRGNNVLPMLSIPKGAN